MNDQLDPGSRFFFEAFGEDHRRNPLPLYARMRSESPVIDTGMNMWVVFRHADCWDIVRAPTASSDERRATLFRREAETIERLRLMMDRDPQLVFLDPPDHTRLRRLVMHGFTPRRIDQLRERVIALTDSMFDAMAIEAAANDGVVDIVEAIAYPLPIAIISELLGVPREDGAQFRVWSTIVAKSVDPGILRTDDENVQIDQANVELSHYFNDLLHTRTEDRGDDLLSALLDAQEGDDRLTTVELVELAKLLLIAGHETTVGLIGNGLEALLNHPDQLALWRADPLISLKAVDELLRFDSPVQMVQRIATEPMTVGGHTIPVGDQIICFLASANHDDTVFDNPDALRLDRPNANRHVAFGGGIHHCLGATLARMEAEIVLGRLIERFAVIEQVGESTMRPSFNLRGRASLRVRIAH